MKNHMRRLGTLYALVLLVLTAAAGAVLAQDDGRQTVPAQSEGEPMATTLVGQLSEEAGGGYILVEEESGDKIRLEGSDELAEHVGTKVKVTGEWANDSEGKLIFRVSTVKKA